MFECEGHPADEFSPMGETVYCDGTCRPDMVMGTKDGEWIHPSDDYEIYGEDEF